MEPETMNDCAGEDQHQVTGLNWTTGRGMTIGSTNESDGKGICEKGGKETEVRKR
jgi:hypothetical protein